MRKSLILFALLFFANISHSYTGIYIGWQNFVSPVLPTDVQANTFNVGIIGTTPTRVYFYHNVIANIVLTQESSKIAQLGWGLDIAGGIGYRFLNTAYKKSGWDLGLDVFAYFNPYFLNSETGYTETALYYGAGLGVNTMYKINPHIGVGFRVTLKYNIGTSYLSSEAPSAQGLLFSIGSFLSF